MKTWWFCVKRRLNMPFDYIPQRSIKDNNYASHCAKYFSSLVLHVCCGVIGRCAAIVKPAPSVRPSQEMSCVTCYINYIPTELHEMLWHHYSCRRQILERLTPMYNFQLGKGSKRFYVTILIHTFIFVISVSDHDQLKCINFIFFKNIDVFNTVGWPTNRLYVRIKHK